MQSIQIPDRKHPAIVVRWHRHNVEPVARLIKPLFSYLSQINVRIKLRPLGILAGGLAVWSLPG